jgi:chromosome segregation ATPase
LQARDLELSENKKSLKENERQLQAKIASIEKLEAQIRGLEDEIKNEKEKHRLTKNEKDDLNSKLHQLERDAEKQKISIEDLRETIGQLKKNLQTQAKKYCDDKEELGRQLRGSEEQARKLQETIKNVDARLAKKDEELESIMAAGDINRQIIDLLDTIKKKESKIQELKEEATRKETEHGSIQNERNTLLERIHELEQNASLIKNEHEKRVKRLEEEIVQLRKQIDEQAQNCIEARAELSTCQNEYEAQFTKLRAETSSDLTQSRKRFDELQKEIQVLNGNLEVKDKELARMGKALDDTEKRISNSRDVVEKRYSIIENLPIDVATVKSTLDDIQRMISEQQQNAYNEKTNSGSLHSDEDARRGDSKNFTELGNQVRKLERAITEQCAKNDSQIKVGALQDEIMNLQRSGALLQAEINIAQARRNDAEADAAKWIGEYKLLENRMRKAEAQNQFLDAKLKVELEGQESVNRNYEGLRADSSISALMTQIGENSKALSQFFDQYKGDVDQVKSLHSRLEALRAELREVESRVDICTGVLGSTSVHSLPGLVNLGIRQPDDKVEGKIVKKVSLLIEKALLKIRSLEAALAAKESEAELAALQCEMTIQEADRMHPPLWKEVQSSPRAATPGSEPEISFHTPESINRRIEQCKTGPIKGIDDTQHKHKDSPVNLYPPLPLSADTKSASTQTRNPQPGKGLAIDGTAVAPRTCTHKAHAPEVLVEKIAADVDKSFSDLEQFRLSVLLHQLSAILSIGKTSSVLKPLLSAGYIYPLAKIGKRNLALLNDAIEAESLPAPEPLEVLLHKALGGMKFKRRQVFSGASLQTYVVIFEIFIDLKRTMYNAKHGIHKERAEETMVSEQHRPTNRSLRAAATRNIPVIKVRARLKSGEAMSPTQD